MGCSLIVRNQLCVIGLACIICLLCLHHNHTLGPNVHSYALVGVHICTNYALVTGGQDGVWGRFLDSGHKLEKVLEKILLVECKSAADEKSKEWQWGLFNKVKLPQQNLFIATFCMLYTRIQIHSLTKYIWSTTPCFPIHVWTLWPTSPYPSMRSQSLSTFPKEPILSERGSNKLYLYSYFIFWYLYYCINVVSERDGHSWSLNNFDITYFDSAEWA